VQISLRDWRRTDFETLWGIDQKCFPPGISYSRLELAAYMRRPQAFTVVAESIPDAGFSPPPYRSAYAKRAEILGFIVGESDRRGAGHIITIDVLPEMRRSGLGSRLLEEAENRLRERQCGSVVLEAAVNNEAALAFYNRHGYSVVKTVPKYYPNGLDAFTLRKDLLSAANAS
jgi:[ribosomal protein S18]-alanine N-acetyltransferase